tara:strand:- start:1133 stop:1714 length:582 start_codon:yes stop_codon:yes gene_type:complete
MKQVAIYCRVSTKDQNCDRQLVELREIAANHGWIVVDEYVDHGISGAKKQRPELDRLKKDAFARRFQMVMTLELSRIGRNTSHLLELVDFFQHKNIDLYIHNQQVDTSTATGKLFFTVASAFMTFERDCTAERVSSGIRNARKKNGGVWGRRTNLTPTIEDKIKEMRSKQIGLKKIAAECSVGVKTVRTVLAA